jgi:hypothetical protein
MGCSSGGGFRSVTRIAVRGTPSPETAGTHAASLPEKYPPFADLRGPLNRAGTIRRASVTGAILPGRVRSARAPIARPGDESPPTRAVRGWSAGHVQDETDDQQDDTDPKQDADPGQPSDERKDYS